jgi:putative FmdB family regulatory protein
MPIYEYLCQKCGHDFEALQKVSDAPLRKCPECGALRLKKLVSKPTFRLKGTGWYETDFKKDGKRLLAEAGDGKASDGASADTATKDDKKDTTEKKDAGDKSAGPEKKVAKAPTKNAASSSSAAAD